MKLVVYQSNNGTGWKTLIAEDDDGGYRLAGAGTLGNSRPVLTAVLNERDRRELRTMLDKADRE